MSRKLRHRSHHGAHPEDQNSAHDEDYQNDLEMLAYQYWQERGSPIGSPEEDWFRAEAELRRQAEAATRL